MPWHLLRSRRRSRRQSRDPRHAGLNPRELKEQLGYEKDRDCFLKATKGNYACAERGMRVLQSCIYQNHDGDIGNDVCGPILVSVGNRMKRIEAQWGHDIVERVKSQLIRERLYKKKYYT